jgi:hypothetical protein
VEREIISPRPFYYEDENPKGKLSLVLGTKHSGVLLLVSKEGLEFNGYYSGNDKTTKYGVMREFAMVSWEEVEKLRESLHRKRKKKVVVKDRMPDVVEEEINEAYLEKLPIVTLNGMKFYIDADRRERRPVSSPSHVFKFSSAFTEEK